MNREELLSILACPKCLGSLQFVSSPGREGLKCGQCNVVYPIREQIPVMLINEAQPFEEWENMERDKCES